MTCIVGLVHEGIVYIGGDSAGINASLQQTSRADQKVFINGEFVMGFTSSFRMGQLLRYALKLPAYHPDVEVMTYMVNDFINAVRDCLKNGGYARKEKEAEEGGVFLVGFRGQLFTVYDDYQVGQPSLAFDAVGCGDDIARGAMFSNGQLYPEQRITQALEAAETFSAGVRRPFVIKSSK